LRRPASGFGCPVEAFGASWLAIKTSCSDPSIYLDCGSKIELCMFGLGTFSWVGRLLFPVLAASFVAAQSTAPAGNPPALATPASAASATPALAKLAMSDAAKNSAALDKLVDSVIQK